MLDDSNSDYISNYLLLYIDINKYLHFYDI